jgi:NMD protein affecting ribosome stability and mRNA decay
VNGYYCATFNVRQTNTTYYSKDKEEINDLIRKEIAKGFKRV